MLAPPIVHLEAIDRDQLNRALVDWHHKMGPWERPLFGREWLHGLHWNGALVGVTAAAPLIRESCAGLSRDQAMELGRICAGWPGLCRAVLRLWRELLFPALGYEWVVSYQDAVAHSGNLYRFDGWLRLGTSSSGTDPRGDRRGRRKVIWGWARTAEAMEQRRAA